MNKRTVLIVDDSQVNRQILCKILGHDYHVFEAKDGVIALSILRENKELISAVLLDIVMPLMDGYEVLRQMRADPLLSKIPVIVASGQQGEEAELKSLALGANDYILKPYHPQIIRHRIANTILLRETASLANSAQRDELTGLYNQAHFYRHARELIQDNPHKKYDLICCDVERFKLVNELYGTQTGDRLLCFIADALTSHIQQHDICGRIGADLFACLIEHQPSYQNSEFAKAIETINTFDINLKIVLRYGIYEIEDRSTPVNIMCDRACLAKESIKGKYGIYFSYYDDAKRQKLIDEQFITSNMKAALEEGQFRVYFQAKYSLKTGQIAGAEALVRWIHPQKGFLSPAAFIPLFERNGFITDLDLYVWEQCCQKLRRWMDMGHTPTPLSVNVSRADIYHPNLSEILRSMLQRYRISPQYLHLEITETAYTENPEQLIGTVEQLKQIGFIIEMDDFGAGYSSLNMLSELPIDILKLDIKFIQSEQKKKNSRSILSFIISLAKWLDLPVIAEGVETEAQVQLLQSLNCEYAQGFYYSKPIPQGDFEELLLQSSIQTAQTLPTTDMECALSDSPGFLLILDRSTVDYQQLAPVFQKNYSIVQARQLEDALEFVQNLRNKLSLCIFNGSELAGGNSISSLQTACHLHNIPLLMIADTLNQSVKDALHLGISDYILRPYEADALSNRVANVIRQAELTQFEQERKINSAMLEMKRRAEEDSLTGLLNRAEFEVRIDTFFQNPSHSHGAFVILDVDNFKQINDTFGHLVGDKALCGVAECLKDVFSETNLISRMGGDEFSVFIPYEITRGSLERKFRQLRQSIASQIDQLHMSCSIGISLIPQDGIDYEHLYRNADIALLTAKRNGKNQYLFFENNMELPLATQLEGKATRLLDDTSDAMFVSDAITSEIIYINETACHIVGKEKYSCLGLRCYQLFWERCFNCDRCLSIDSTAPHFYEEDTFLKDQKTFVHIKAKLGYWDGRRVKIHYLQPTAVPDGGVRP